MRKAQKLLEQLQELKQENVPWLDLSDPYHQLGVVSAVIVIMYAIGEGGLPISVPWWQLALVAGLIYYVMFTDGPVPQLEEPQNPVENQLPDPSQQKDLD